MFHFQIEDQKCNPNERDFDGATPLHFAASRGHYRVVEWMLQQGRAKVTLDNLGGSPLHNAAEVGNLQVGVGQGSRSYQTISGIVLSIMQQRLAIYR